MKLGRKDIDGFYDYIMVDVLPNDYEDISSVKNWCEFGNLLFKDYKFIRKRLQGISFDGLSVDEKIIVCQYRASTESNCKTTLGDSFDYWMTEFDLKSQECRKIRFAVAKTILIKNISLMDRYNVLGFLNTTNLEDNYIKYGIEGTSEGDPIEGIFNYIEATGGYAVTGIAAGSLTMIGTKTKNEMITEMMDCLRNGNY